MANPNSSSIPRPEQGDVVELILEDHRLFESLLRELRNEQNDRDALRQQIAELLVAHGEAEESKVYPQLERKDAIDEEEAEHGKKEHEEGYETLLPLLEADRALRRGRSATHLHEFSETAAAPPRRGGARHPQPRARGRLRGGPRPARVRPGSAERNRMLDEGCGSVGAGARARRRLLKLGRPRRHPATPQPALPAALDRQHRHGRRRPAHRGGGAGADLRADRLLGVRRADRCLRPGPARRLRALGRRARRRHRPAHAADLHHDRADRDQRAVLAAGVVRRRPTCGCCSACSRCSRRSSRSTSRPAAPYSPGCCRCNLLPAANSLNMTVMQAGAIGGPLIAGALIPVFGFPWLYLIDTAHADPDAGRGAGPAAAADRGHDREPRDQGGDRRAALPARASRCC